MRIINIKKLLKKVSGKIWEPQIIKKYFYKVSGKYIGSTKNINL